MAAKISGTAADGRDYSFFMDLQPGFVTDGEIANQLSIGQFYEPDVSAAFATIVRPGDYVIDVGANVGWFTLLAAALVGPEGRVDAFEPDPRNGPKLSNNINLNHFEHVSVHHGPLSDTVEEVTFHKCIDGSGGSALWDPGLHPLNPKTRAAPETLVMKTRTIDEWMADEGPVNYEEQPVRLIKVDVEGAEGRVLAGARDLLLIEQPPFVIAEMHEFGLQQMGSSQMKLRHFMHSLGYETYVLWADGFMPMMIPIDTTVDSELILNLMYSKPSHVAECWPSLKLGRNRPPVYGYGAR